MSKLDRLREELIRDEGLRLESYQDTVGLWTIGVGHLLGPERRMLRITPAEADALLTADIDAASDLAARLVGVPLDDVRERAIINMSFNLGPRLDQFKKFLAAVNARDWETAAKEMMDSKWARQVGKRAERLRDMILTGA